MDRKKIIIIGVILIIIVAAIAFVILTTVNYERIDITPNGTTIDVPAGQTKYHGDIEGIKIWNWDNGILITYNSNADINTFEVTDLTYNSINNLIKAGTKQNISGVTCYVINADDLLEIHMFDIIKINYNGKFYCIPLSNESSHDKVLICSNNKDIAVHMAQSIQYKNVYPNAPSSTIQQLTGDLKSTANDYLNNTSIDDIKSTVNETAEYVYSKANGYVNDADLNDIKSSIEEKAGQLMSKSLH